MAAVPCCASHPSRLPAAAPPRAVQVYSTVASGLLPDPSAIGTTDDIYTWLQQLLVGVWQDPICGDGMCEVPFEYAAYGRCAGGCVEGWDEAEAVQLLTHHERTVGCTHHSTSAVLTAPCRQRQPAACPANRVHAAPVQVWLPRRLRPPAGHPESHSHPTGPVL